MSPTRSRSRLNSGKNRKLAVPASQRRVVQGSAVTPAPPPIANDSGRKNSISRIRLRAITAVGGQPRRRARLTTRRPVMRLPGVRPFQASSKPRNRRCAGRTATSDAGRAAEMAAGEERSRSRSTISATNRDHQIERAGRRGALPASASAHGPPTPFGRHHLAGELVAPGVAAGSRRRSSPPLAQEVEDKQPDAKTPPADHVAQRSVGISCRPKPLEHRRRSGTSAPRPSSPPRRRGPRAPAAPAAARGRRTAPRRRATARRAALSTSAKSSVGPWIDSQPPSGSSRPLAWNRARKAPEHQAVVERSGTRSARRARSRGRSSSCRSGHCARTGRPRRSRGDRPARRGRPGCCAAARRSRGSSGRPARPARRTQS